MYYNIHNPINYLHYEYHIEIMIIFNDRFIDFTLCFFFFLLIIYNFVIYNYNYNIFTLNYI